MLTRQEITQLINHFRPIIYYTPHNLIRWYINNFESEDIARELVALRWMVNISYPDTLPQGRVRTMLQYLQHNINGNLEQIANALEVIEETIDPNIFTVFLNVLSYLDEEQENIEDEGHTD